MCAVHLTGTDAGAAVSDPSPTAQGWAGLDSHIARYVVEVSRQSLDAYRARPLLVTEHANIERATAQGGYGRRQIYELVQNGADALLGSPGGRIHVVLTASALYCANQGEPISPEGADAILSSYISDKRGMEIGRFGLGFKSVLGVTDRPQFYSRSGSFGFNAKDAEQRIREIVPEADRFPVLRLARPLDPDRACAEDSTLKELMDWAATVVKLPRDPQSSDWLSEDIADFPVSFLLFSPHVGTLTLEDRPRNVQRDIRLRTSGKRITLEADGGASEWQVFDTTYTPSQHARQDAGELADRESLPIMWAVPLQGKTASSRGQFWAFFPTEYVTTLSGIINAPWKTNEDRQNLLTGVFNTEMIEAAALLVASRLPFVESEDDPGRFLDLMPARGREAPNWADGQLTEQVYRYAAKNAVIPDQSGRRRRAEEVCLHPEGIPDEALKIWADYSGRPMNWCHHSVDSRERRSRVERLFALAGKRQESISAWLEALVDDGTPESSLAAIRTAATLVGAADSSDKLPLGVQWADIVLTRDGSWVTPTPGTVFVAHHIDSCPSSIVVVHEHLSSSDEGRAALRVLGIQEVDVSSELQAILGTNQRLNLDDHEWEAFWNLVAKVPPDRALELLRSHLNDRTHVSLSVRTVSGEFRPLHWTLLPGDIVPDDGGRDATVAIDTEYHASVLTILTGLGATPIPRSDGAKTTELWYSDYRRWAIREFHDRNSGRGSANEGYLVFDGSSASGPMDSIFYLSEEGNALLTERLLYAAEGESSWKLYHETRSDHYQAVTLPHPCIWVARTRGRVKTSLGIRKVCEAVGLGLQDLNRVFPVSRLGEALDRRLELPGSASDLSPEHWNAALTVAETLEDGEVLADFYATAARWSVASPKMIRCRQGTTYELHTPASVAIAWNSEESAALRRSEMPFLRVKTQEDADTLASRWGLQRAPDVIKLSVFRAPSGPETPLLDRFPGLGRHLSDEQATLGLLPCSSLRQDTLTAQGRSSEECGFLRDGDVLCFVDRLGNAELLDEVALCLGIHLRVDERTSILEQRELNDRRLRIVEIRTKSTLAERLLTAVGPAAIRRRLPTALAQAARERYGPLSDVRAAELVTTVYGVETLHEFREELERAGLTPPVQWAGSHNARKFVQELGFPKEYAGFGQARRDAFLEVDCPPNLPPLHGFQEAIVERIHALLERKSDDTRGLLSLPTGAGKTRVVVEALVQAIGAGRLGGPILWVAQTDELCEQAVQTWSEVWRSIGSGGRLRINRLWATNEADPYEDAPQVVVATDRKLTAACIPSPDYGWLTEATCVVIDEAHISTQPSYTDILGWLSLQRGSERCPLIGLTATPFRGGEDETKHLVGRYGRNRLDWGALSDDPYAELQEMGVLAQVDHQILDGVTLELNPEELEHFKTFLRLPTTVDDRIAENATRNQVLLQSILSLQSDWPVLLFAASVNHARAMAALLSAEGISAAAISADTEPGARRHYVEQFRRGGLRVLTNYAVLTAGFDAPSVRALYVARPTYSPVLYQQMIGRGLRGPLNGGKERCLIVNVKDNIVQYGEQLAFTRFEYLWNPQ